MCYSVWITNLPATKLHFTKKRTGHLQFFYLDILSFYMFSTKRKFPSGYRRLSVRIVSLQIVNHQCLTVRRVDTGELILMAYMVLNRCFIILRNKVLYSCNGFWHIVLPLVVSAAPSHAVLLYNPEPEVMEHVSLLFFLDLIMRIGNCTTSAVFAWLALVG